MRRCFFGCWTQYNHVLSGALDIGLALTVVMSGLALGLSGSTFPDWWGNGVPYDNVDMSMGAVIKMLPDDGSFFGPTTW